MSTYISLQHIKPCPKCNSVDVFSETTIDETACHFVACGSCGFESKDCPSRHIAIEYWNHITKVSA